MKVSSITKNSGDSFLLEDDNKVILFDAGRNYDDIKDCLPKTIDIAICSHNDCDHSNGFIGLLDDYSKIINEIWLPGYWQPILGFIKDIFIKHNRIQCSCKNTDVAYFKKISKIHEIEFDDNDLLKNTEENIEQFNLSFLTELDTEILDFFFQEFWFRNIYDNLLLTPQIEFKTNNIIKIVKLAIERDNCKIRWFHPLKEISLQKKLIQNLYPINSFEVVKIKKIKNNNFISFLQLLQLSTENKYSLVFEYHKDNKPIVLFTADNDLFFVDSANPLVYNNEIVITAPHHGSDSCINAYSKIKVSTSIKWIRSNGPKNKNAGKALINHISSSNYICYCDYCKDYNEGNLRIELKYVNYKWYCIKGAICICR